MSWFERVLASVLVIVGGVVSNAQDRSKATSQASQSSDQSTADPDARGYLSANGLLNRGLYELAAAEYRTFLTAHPNHEKAAAARYGLGVCLFRMEKYDQAVIELGPLVGEKSFTYAAEVGTIVAQSQMALKRYPEAAAGFEQVIDQHPNSPLAPAAAAGAAEARYRTNDFEKTAFWTRQMGDRWPDSPHRSRVALFGCMAEMARKDFPAAARHCGLVIELDPKGPFADQATFLLAQCQEQTGSSSDAVQNYERVLQSSDAADTVDALFALAALHYREERLDEAAKHLDRLLERAKESDLAPSAMLLRGRVWFDQGRWDQAFAMFERATQHAGAQSDPACEAAYWMAKCRLRQENYADAILRLREAAKRFADCRLAPELTYDLAVALVKKGDADGAVETLRAFLTRHIDHPLTPDALHLLAMSEHQQGRFDESLLVCNEFLKRFPTHEFAATISFLGAENEFLGKRDPQAVDLLRLFLNRHPTDSRVRLAKLRLGTALVRLDKPDEAAPFLAEVADGNNEGGHTFSSALLALGDIHFQRGEWKTAEDYLKRYLASGADVPGADDAMLKLGLSIQRQDRASEALTVYDELLRKHPQSPHRLQATFERGQALMALDRRDDAERAFQEVLKAGEDSRFAPHALNHLATIASVRGDAAKAATLYERVTAVAPADDARAEALMRQGRSELAARRFDAAAAVFQRFIQSYPADPRSAEARGLLGTALARLDKCEEALTALDSALTTPANQSNANDRSSFLYERAWCLRSLKRTDDAARTYGAVIDLGPSDVLGHALLELAGIEMAAGRFDAAAESLRRLRELAKGEGGNGPSELREQGSYQLAVCEFESKRYKIAVELFDEFLARFPDSSLVASASFLAGEANFQEGRFDAATAHLKRVVEQHSSDAVFAPALLRLAECHAQAQRWSASERAYADYLDRFAGSPQWFQAQFGLGWAREQQKRYDEAIRAYETVVAKHQGPTAARALFQIGECLFAQNRFDEAARELLKVDILYAYPEWSAAALYEAARCFERMNKTAEAQDHFRQVAEKHGETRWAQLATQRLSELSAAASVPGR